jgi:uncharacterized protein
MRYGKYAILLIFFLAVPAAFAVLPAPVGFVNDYAGILPNAAILEKNLSDYEKATTIEIAIATIEALPPDQNIYTYSVELFQQWGIGKKGEDNGILVLIIKNGTTGNRLKIELGYSIQGYITGAEAGRILDRALPYYNQGDYATTANIIIDGLMDDLNDYQPGKIVQGQGAPFSENYDYIPYVIILLIWISSIGYGIYSANRCPSCHKRMLESRGDYWVCKNCGKKIKKRRYATAMAGGFAGGFGGGGGGFGGGGSGGGGAGR